MFVGVAWTVEIVNITYLQFQQNGWLPPAYFAPFCKQGFRKIENVFFSRKNTLFCKEGF